MIVVLACAILQCLNGNLRFMTLIESLQITVVINVKLSAMYVYVCLNPVVISTYVFGHGGQTDLFLKLMFRTLKTIIIF